MSPDLSQYLPLLATTDDAAIASMAGCAVEAVAAFRAVHAPPVVGAPPEPTEAEKAPEPTKPERVAKPDRRPKDAPAQPEMGLDEFVASLSHERARVLFLALQERLYPRKDAAPEPVEAAAPPALDAPPAAVRLTRSATLTDAAGKPRRYNLKDVFGSTEPALVAHLWGHHRDAVERYPVER